MKKALNLFGITLVVALLASCPQSTSNNVSPPPPTDTDEWELKIIGAKTMFVGGTQQLDVENNDDESFDSQKLKWTVSKGGEEYLSIDEKGFATAKDDGAVSVTAKYGEASSEKFEIVISEKDSTEPSLSHSMTVSDADVATIDLSKTDDRIGNDAVKIMVGKDIITPTSDGTGIFTATLKNASFAGAVTYSVTDTEGNKYEGIATGPGDGKVFYMGGKGYELSDNIGKRIWSQVKDAVYSFNAGENSKGWKLPTIDVLKEIHGSFYATGLIPVENRDAPSPTNGGALWSNTQPSTSTKHMYALNITLTTFNSFGAAKTNANGYGVRAVRALGGT